MTSSAAPEGALAIRIVHGDWAPPPMADASAVAIIERAMTELRNAKRQVDRSIREFTVPVGSSDWRAYSVANSLAPWFMRKAFFVSDPLRQALDRLVSKWPEVTREVLKVCPDSHAWLPTPEALADLLAVKVECEPLTQAHLAS